MFPGGPSPPGNIWDGGGVAVRVWGTYFDFDSMLRARALAPEPSTVALSTPRF